MSCWDLNGNNIQDSSEDVNTDGLFNALDCQKVFTSATYRWSQFSTYLNNVGWVIGNNSSMFGGINPSIWTDGSGLASGMSNDSEVLRTLFTRKGYGGSNAMIMSDVYHQYSSTTGKVATALFRIKNTTSAAIDWTPYFYYSCNSSWGERASIAINGLDIWNSGGTNCGSSNIANTIISIPANAISTIIFVSTSSLGESPGSNIYVRLNSLAFYNDSLALPSGLKYIDDLDTVTGNLW